VTAAPSQALAQRLLDALPQTQCTRCGYPDCAAYAQAIADGQAPINQCPPGGDEGVHRLADLTGQPWLPLNPLHGEEKPLALAVIDEDWCIGCTLCLKACPTDAIVGSHKRMHTVIEAHCTGCELCLPACPVDCIQMVNASGERTGWQAWGSAQADHARQRYAQRQARLPLEAQDQIERRITKAEAKLADLGGLTHTDSAPELDRKRSVVQAALERARRQRSGA
jgi:electron transport complex protein RnfB